MVAVGGFERIRNGVERHRCAHASLKSPRPKYIAYGADGERADTVLIRSLMSDGNRIVHEHACFDVHKLEPAENRIESFVSRRFREQGVSAHLIGDIHSESNGH